MARFITFNGVTLYHPGGLSKVDATALAQVGAGVTGVIGLIGEADSGQPNTATVPKVYQFTDPQSAIETFKGGELADAINFIFNPSSDVRIPGGAQKVICIKTNQDTQSSTILNDQSLVTSSESIKVTSRAYGVSAQDITFDIDMSAVDANKFDVTVKDGKNGITESFTSLGGTALMNVKYVGPENPVIVPGCANLTGVSASGGEGLTILTGDTGSAAGGQWVRILTDGTADNSKPFVVGQIRRIASVVADTSIILETGFVLANGSAEDLPANSTFDVIRTVVGPFYVDSATNHATDKKFKTQSVPAIAAHSSAWAVGDPTFRADTADAAYYGAVANGPGYVKITAGKGVGQIRRVVGVTAGTLVAESETPEIEVDVALSPAPDSTSKFMFINAVHSAASNSSGHGAVGAIKGVNGAASSLTFGFRPGYGESIGLHATTNILKDGANVNPYAVYIYDLGSTVTVNSLVSKINSSTGGLIPIPNVTAHPAGSWVAQVGPGRSGGLTTDRFDFMKEGGTSLNTDVSNGGELVESTGADCVDLLCDFNQQYSATFKESGQNPGTSTDAAIKRHRFLDNCAQLVDTLNNQSILVTAIRETGTTEGGGIPDFTGIPVALSTGGVSGATTALDVVNAFNELIKIRHNTCVALWSSSSEYPTNDIADLHSLLSQHANNGAAGFKNEVDCIAGFTPPSTTTALADVTARASTINSRNVALVYQQIKRTDVTGTGKTFEPHMLACAVAGMQAGSAVGEPLTFKFVDAQDIVSAVNADPQDKSDSDLMLQSGVLFCEKVQGSGFRIVRNLSTHTADDNLAFTDRHVNYELNFMSYDLRTELENKFTGIKSTPATVASMKSTIIGKLSFYRNDLEIIVDSNDPVTGATLNAYRNLKVSISGDIATIRFEVFPAIGINYQTIEIFAQLPTISA